jgi:hypothetical protein
MYVARKVGAIRLKIMKGFARAAFDVNRAIKNLTELPAHGGRHQFFMHGP